MRTLTWAIAGMASAIASPALAVTVSPNCATFEVLGRGVDQKYDPYRPSNFVDTFTLRVTRLNDAVTSVRFIFVDNTPQGLGPKFGADGPELYNIDWIPDQSRSVFTTGAQSLTELNSAFVGFSGRQDDRTTQFRLTIPKGQTVLAGRQVERLAVRYQCFAGGTAISNQSDAFNGLVELAIEIPRMVTAYVGGVGKTHGEIDFGTLSANSDLRKDISVTAMSTLPYAIDVSTENGLQLTRGTGRDGAIGYGLKVAGLEMPRNATIKCPVTPMPTGEDRRVEVALDKAAIQSQPAGDYSDTITLTFRPSDGYSGTACAITRITQR